jgi:dephospho-CoA kinase
MPRGETMMAGRARTAGASMVLLCGPSGAGKSTLARGLVREGWRHLDGDALAKGLYVPGSALLRDIVRVFGKQVLRPDRGLDAQRLGEIVFPSPGRLKALNRLVYPRFERALRKAVAEARRRGGRLVVDVPVYFDLGAPDLGLPVVLLTAPLAVRVARLRARGLSPARARARARSLRFGRAEKARADLVLDGRRPPRALLQGLKAFLEAR